MAGKLMHIRNKLHCPCADSSSAHTFPHGNLHTGNLSLERAKHQLAAMHEIKTGPVQVRQFGIEDGACIGHCGQRQFAVFQDGLDLAVHPVIQLLFLIHMINSRHLIFL